MLWFREGLRFVHVESAETCCERSRNYGNGVTLAIDKPFLLASALEGICGTSAFFFLRFLISHHGLNALVVFNVLQMGLPCRNSD